MLKKAILCLLVFASLLSFTACGSKPKAETEPEKLGYILTNYSLLPDSITNIPCCFLDNDKIILCCWEEREDATVSYAATLQADGTDFQKLPLDLPENAIMLTLASDGQGGLWAVHMIPNGDEDTPANYTLCHFEADGSLADTIPLNELMEESGSLRFASDRIFLNRDKDGNLCVTVKSSGAYCYLFDRSGNYLFSLTDPWNPEAIISKADGQLTVFDTVGDGNYHLLPINMEAKAFDYEARVDLGAVSSVFSGGESSDYYFYDFSEFFSVDPASGEKKPLFNWSNLGLASGDAHVCPLPDGKFAVIAGTFSQTQQLRYEFCIVEPGIDDRTVLTMFSLQPESSILEAIALFNKSNDEYRIELTSVFSMSQDVTSDEWNNAIQKFSVELIAGEIPDILDLNNLPVEALSSSGYLVDLYPYLNNDPAIHMEDYYDNVFTALSMHGKLPFLTSSVQILTMFADEKAVGTKRGWTVEEYAALKNNGDIIVSGLDPMQFLEMLLAADSQFVNWETGECRFDSEAFIRLLELCKSMSESEASTQFLSSDSQANCRYAPLTSVIFVAEYNYSLGRNANPIGFPNESGDVMHILIPANKIGITTACEHADGAWAFARSFLEPTLQESGWFFPYLKSSFEKIAAATVKGNTIWSGGMYNGDITEQDLTLAREVLGSALYCRNGDAGLTEIILDCVQDYFYGDRSAQEVAALIQQKATIYVSEHK